MPVEWDQFEAVDTPQTNPPGVSWDEFEAVNEPKGFKDLTQSAGLPPVLDKSVGKLQVPAGEQLTTYGGPRNPLASYAETMVGAESDISESPLRAAIPRPSLTEPRVALHTEEITPDQGAASAALAELYNVAKGLPEFLTSDAGILSMLGAKVSPRLMSAGFSADMLHSAYAQAKNAYADWGTLTPSQKAKSIVDVASSLFMGEGLAAHTVKPGPDLPRATAGKDLLGPPTIGEMIPTPKGAPVPAGEPVTGPETVSAAESLARAQQMTREATLSGVESLPKPPRPTVPGEENDLQRAYREIREKTDASLKAVREALPGIDVGLLPPDRPGQRVNGARIRVSPDGKRVEIAHDLIDRIAQQFPGQESEVLKILVGEEQLHHKHIAALGDGFEQKLADIWKGAPKEIQDLVRSIYSDDGTMEAHHWGAELLRMGEQARTQGRITESFHKERGGLADSAVEALAKWHDEHSPVADTAAKSLTAPPKEFATWDDAVAELQSKGKGSETQEQIKALFPQLKLSNETAKRLAKDAFGDEWKPGGQTPQAAPAPDSPVGQFTKTLASPDFKGGNDLSTAAGMGAKSVADLDALAALRDRYTAEQAEIIKRANEMPPGPERDSLIQGVLPIGQKAQLAREAIEVATNSGSWVEGEGMGESKTALGKRPLDWKENKAAADWLRQHGGRMAIDIPDELKAPEAPAPAPAAPAAAPAPTPPPAEPQYMAKPVSFWKKYTTPLQAANMPADVRAQLVRFSKVQDTPKAIAEFLKRRMGELEKATKPAESPETITAAAWLDDSGQVHYGPHHPGILKSVGGQELVDKFSTRESRNTPRFGYQTNLREFITRDMAAGLAEKSGQKLEEFDVDPQTGKETPHSDEIAATPGSKTPLSESEPAPAAAKVEAEVQKVAATEGQRPAKGVKNELIARLEKAVEDAPETAGPKAKPITIEIPGDGTFTVRNTKEALGDLLTRARKVSTTAGTPKVAPRIGGVGDVDAQAEAAAKAYGSVEAAYRSAVRQRDALQSQEPPATAEDRNTWNTQIAGANAIVQALYGKTKAAEFESKAENASKLAATYREGAASFEKELARLRAIKRPTDKHRVDIMQLEERLAENQKRTAQYDKDAEQLEQQAAKEKAALESPQQTKGPGMVGLGGAAAGELEPSAQTATGIKNATVDAERARRGLPPAMQAAKRTFGDVWDRAMAMVDHDPAVVDNLLESLRDKPRALTDTEDALLLHRQIDLQNEYGKATRDLAQAHDDGRTDDVQREKVRVAALSDQLLDLYNIGKAVGTETGRGLNARKMMAYEDFTLAKMEMDKRAANGGRPLTDSERAQITELHAKIAETQQAYDAYRERMEGRLRDVQVKAAIDKAEAEARAKPKIHPAILEAANRIVGQLDQRADAARARIKERLARTSAGIDPTVLLDVAEIGASHLAHGILDFAEWSTRMVGELGDWVKPYLEQAHELGKKTIAQITADKPNAVKRQVGKPTLDDLKDATTKAIADKVSKGQKDKVTWNVQKLARALIQSGVTDREALIDAVHKVMQDAIPGITRREAMDAISGYGDYKQLSKEAITVQLRGMKGEMQQLAKLEDIETRQPPLKSGVERRTPTEEERRLIKQVNDAKRRYGITVTDPDTQLQSALQSRKTALRNQISDLEFEIQQREQIVKSKAPPPTDAELESMKKQRDALREEHEKIFPKPQGMSDEAYAALLDRQKSDLEQAISQKRQQLASGEVAPESQAMNRPARPELEQLRQERDALNKQIQEARKKPADQRHAEQLARQLEAMNKRIEEKEAAIASGNIAPEQGKMNRPMATPELEQAKQKLDALNKRIQELRNPKQSPEVIALKALKTRLENSIADYEDRLARQDYAPKERRELVLDQRAAELKAKAERLKEQFRRAVAQDRLANASRVERAGNWIAKWRRGFILSGPTTLAKLTAAALQRMVVTPVEEAVGGVMGKIIPGVARRAAREGGINARAEARSVTQAITQGMADAWKVLRTGKSDLDVLYGREALEAPSVADFFGHVHGALKAPVKRAEFARALEKRTTAAVSGGVDVSDPMVQSRLVIESYKDANRSIFMQDNRVVDAYNGAIRRLEAPDKSTGKVPAGGKAAATAARVLLPIVKVPTNIVAETLQYALGTVTGSARLGRAFARGIENLSPDEADLIMRSLKKGSLGAAVMALGFLNPSVVGGYYQKGQKRPKNDVQAGRIRVYGHDIPSILLHNPLLETAQLGATIRRVADSKLRKRDTDKQGISAGLMAGGLGLIEEVPFVREQLETVKAFDPYQREAFFGELGKSLLEPRLLQEIAEALDKNARGEPVKRKPQGTVDYLKTGVPVLRQQVPVGAAK